MRLIAIVAAAASLYAQTPGPDVAFDLTTPAGVIAGKLRMPTQQQFSSSTSEKVHAVLIVAGSDQAATKLAEELALRNFASVRYEKPGSVDDASFWIAKLRNDNRFKSVTVAAFGEHSLAGVMAAREGRADGFVSIAGSNQSPEFSRLLRPTRVILDPADAAVGIAAYINGLTLPPHAHGDVRRSPRTVTAATIDGVRMAVEYGQLGVRDREIWGALVAWNKQWMPGADESTTLTTSAPIVLGGLAVPAGDYTLWALPSEENFILQVSKRIYNFHTDYNASWDLGRVKMTMTKLDQPAELLRFQIVPTATGGMLKFAWADREYAVAFQSQK